LVLLSSRSFIRVPATLLLVRVRVRVRVLAAAGVCLALRTPLPWMIGPLLK
jgi:hypothetical protein